MISLKSDFAEAIQGRVQGIPAAFRVLTTTDGTVYAALSGDNRTVNLYELNAGTPVEVLERMFSGITLADLFEADLGAGDAVHVVVAVEETLTLFRLDGSNLSEIGTTSIDPGEQIARLRAIQTEQQGHLILTWTDDGDLSSFIPTGAGLERAAVNFPVDPIPELVQIEPWYRQALPETGTGPASGFATIEVTADGTVARAYRYSGASPPFEQLVLEAERSVADGAFDLAPIGHDHFVASSPAGLQLLSMGPDEETVVNIVAEGLSEPGAVSASGSTLSVVKLGGRDRILLFQLNRRAAD